jgi:hypothetical protein
MHAETPQRAQRGRAVCITTDPLVSPPIEMGFAARITYNLVCSVHVTVHQQGGDLFVLSQEHVCGGAEIESLHSPIYSGTETPAHRHHRHRLTHPFHAHKSDIITMITSSNSCDCRLRVGAGMSACLVQLIHVWS